MKVLSTTLWSALLLAAAGCSGQATVADAQASMDQVIRQALEVRLDGWGGCLERVGQPEKLSIDVFPEVTFWLARCTLEHGQPGAAVVAHDMEGVLYLPGSEESFRFLVSRHPPTSGSLGNSLTYASLALRLMARAEWSASVITDATELSGEIRNAIEEADRSVVSSTEGGMPIVVTLASDHSVDRFSVIIDEAGGVTVGEHVNLWSSLD